jgi:amino acid adenylation domain-containing protein
MSVLATEVARLAASRPDRPAVVFGEQTWTFAQLADSVAAVVARLRDAGVRRPDRMVVSSSDRYHAVVGALAAMAVGSYVPVDPSYPASRRHQVTAQVGALLVLTDEVAEQPVPTVDVRTADLPTGTGGPTWPSGLSPAAPDDVVYIMLTSGTTGEPKQVPIVAGALELFFRDLARTVPGLAEARVLHAASMSFDASILELAMWLAGGGVLDISARDPLSIRRVLARTTHAMLTPSMLRQTTAADLAHLEVLVCGGERLRAHDLDPVPRSCQVLNAYGPTEATVWATVHQLGGVRAEGGDPAIGRPVGEAVALLVDETLAPLNGPGEGELLLAGPTITPGYLCGDPTSRAAFVTIDGLRYYRTGDLVRQDDAGLLHYVDRVDRQLKIRGHRIEPGEVETAVTAIPGVRTALVLAVDLGGDQQLAGAIECDSAAGLTARSVQDQLLERLPRWLVPTRWHLAEELPLTSSGKVDLKEVRRLLEAGGLSDPVPSATSGRGTRLLAIVETVLGHQVGPEDDFYLLGGDSLSALKIIDAAQRELGLELPLEDLIGAPTVLAFIKQHESAT